uniref:Uncharacterized protein n=1 Tax=Acrobeloides nanus TaxID=290746 RepID=A0A914CSN4_9BILA
MSHCWLKIFVLIFLKICLCEEKKEALGADYQKVGDLVGEWFKNPWQAAGQMGLDFAKYGLAQAGNNIGNVVQLPHTKNENGSTSRNSGDMLVNLLRLGVALATTPATITPASKQKFQKFTKIRASQREEEMQMVPKYPKSSDVVKKEGNHSQPQLKAAEIGYSNDQLSNSQLESILKVLAKKKVDELDALTRQTTTENPEIVRMREKMQQLEARLMEQQEMLLKKDIEDKYGKIISRHHGDSEEYPRAPDQEDYMPEIRFKQIKDQFHPHQFEKEATPTSSYQKILPLSKIALTKTIPVTPNPSRKLETIETSSNTNTTSSSITSSEMSTRIELPTTTITSSSSNMTQVTTHTIPATSPTRTLLEMSKDNPSSTKLELNQTSTVTTNLSSTTGIIDTYTNPKTPDLTSTEPSQTSLLTTKISSTTGTNTHPETSETDLTTTSTSEKSQTSLLTTKISSITGTNTHPETDLTTASTSETSQTSLLTTEISSTTGTNTHPETSETDLTTASHLDATTRTTDPQVPTMKDSSTTQTISHERKLLLVKTFEEKSIPTGLYKMDEALDIQSSPSNTTQPLILHDLNERRNRKSHFDKYRINKEKNQPPQGVQKTIFYILIKKTLDNNYKWYRNES